MAVIGIDLGGTKITGALFDENGGIRCQVSHLLEKRKGHEVGLLVDGNIVHGHGDIEKAIELWAMASGPSPLP